MDTRVSQTSARSNRRPAFLLALALTCGTCGCSRQDSSESGAAVAPRPDGQKFKFVVVSHATAVPFFVPVRKGVEEAGKLLGVEATFTGPPGFDIARQVEFIQAAIAGGADGIATTMPNPDAFRDVVAEAMARGIPVLALNADAPDSGRLAYIGQGNFEAGQSMGREIRKLLPEGGPVLLCTHTAGAFNLEERLRGVQSILEGAAGFSTHVLATSTDLVKASSLIASYCQGHPDTRGCFGVDDITGSAIAQVIEREGWKGKVYGGGFDLVPDVMSAIQQGTMQFTIDQQPYLQGFQSIVQLYLLKRFQLAPTDVNTGVAAITAANVDTVLKLAAEGYR
jgi:simple sugar transport system substrate-binding protein